MLIVETHDGETVTADQIRAHLETLIVRWLMPDDIVFGPVPLTATGKIDKKCSAANIVIISAPSTEAGPDTGSARHSPALKPFDRPAPHIGWSLALSPDRSLAVAIGR